MKILSEEIVSSTDIIKNYPNCRKKTKSIGKTFIFKNNAPDMVLMDITEYEGIIEKMYELIEEMEHIAIYQMVEDRKRKDTGKRYTWEEIQLACKQ